MYAFDNAKRGQLIAQLVMPGNYVSVLVSCAEAFSRICTFYGPVLTIYFVRITFKRFKMRLREVFRKFEVLLDAIEVQTIDVHANLLLKENGVKQEKNAPYFTSSLLLHVLYVLPT